MGIHVDCMVIKFRNVICKQVYYVHNYNVYNIMMFVIIRDVVKYKKLNSILKLYAF